MAQERITINGIAVKQPDKMDPNFATTYTEDSGRPMGGRAHLTPLFTVESYSVEFSNLTPAQASAILQQIVPTPSRPFFSLHYYSWYYGAWRTAQFYVGQGSMKTKRLKENDEILESITCDFVGRERIV